MRKIFDAIVEDAGEKHETTNMINKLFAGMYDHQVAKYLLGSKKMKFVKLKNVSIANEFQQGDTVYVSIRLNPMKGEMLGNHIQIVPVMEHEGKWFVYDKEMLQTLNKVFSQKLGVDLTIRSD